MAKGKAGKRSKKIAKIHGNTGQKVTKKRKTERPSAAEAPQPVNSGPNPYDLFQNKRRRTSVLGERRSGEKRNLVKSRSSAVGERARGLLKESLSDRRTSTFRDGRLGGDAAGEDFGNSSVQRLVKLRQRQSKRSFSIGANATDELMHDGKPIADMADSDLKQGGEEDEGGEEWDPDKPWIATKSQEAIEKKEHEQQLGKLDDEFGDIFGELAFRPSKAEQLKNDVGPVKKNVPDEYDRLMRELTFERRATAVERLKTPQEIARERAEELEALERDRSARASTNVDDGAHEDEAAPALGSQVADSEPEESEMGEEEGGESEEDADGHDEEESDEGKGESVAKQDGKVPSMSDAAAQLEVDDDDKLGEDCIPLFSTKQVAAVDVMVNSKGEEGLPYSLECPVRKRAIDTLLAGRGPETAVKLVQRVRTCHAVSLAAENREKLRSFFLALLDYAVNVAVRDDGDLSARGLQILYALRPQLVQLAREHPEEAHGYFAERLRVLSPSTLPRVAEVCCLKLIAVIFPVTDFQHPITRPAALLADHWATRIASLGSEIADLTSDAIFLWGALYDITIAAGRFSMSFFQLGTTILDSCWASAKKGRENITDASSDILKLLLKALSDLGENEPAAARVVINELLRPAVQKFSERGILEGTVGVQLKEFVRVLDGYDSQELLPLTLFEAVRPQIRTLEPVFHEEGDAPGRRGADLSETQLLKRKLNDERRAANRQLRRDAGTLQSLSAQKDSARRAARNVEKKRVWKMMDVEKQEIKQMMTEGGGMDTSLQRYSQTKERKRQNKRMAGNQTAESAPKEAKPKPGAKKEKIRKTPKKRKGGR